MTSLSMQFKWHTLARCAILTAALGWGTTASAQSETPPASQPAETPPSSLDDLLKIDKPQGKSEAPQSQPDATVEESKRELQKQLDETEISDAEGEYRGLLVYVPDPACLGGRSSAAEARAARR